MSWWLMSKTPSNNSRPEAGATQNEQRPEGHLPVIDSSGSNPFRFSVHPEVILKLGNELVADEFTALLELAKNAYDAGASRVVVEVMTMQGPASRGSFFPNATGYISIRDNGIGMDIDDISNGWLVVAHSRKRDPKQLGLPFRGTERVPLGDKGIGRLGLQRIGDCVDVISRAANSNNTVHIGYRWSDFSLHDRLDNVTILRQVSPENRPLGTEIIVSDLRDPSAWRGSLGRERLQAKLSQLISPFTHLTEMPLHVALDGEPLNLAQVADSVLATAHCRCDFTWSRSGGLSLKLSYATGFFAQTGKSQELDTEDDAEDLEEVPSTIEVARKQMRMDRCRAFFDFLVADAKVSSFRYIDRESETQDWILQAEFSMPASTIGGLEPDDPGSFSGAILHLPRHRGADSLPSAFSRVKDFRAFLEKQSGVRVYRNGFAVRPYGIDGDDWLLIAAEREAGRSWYYLKPGSTVGWVSISARDNMQLTEKTDREGFVDSPASRNFTRLNRSVVRTINQWNTKLRRTQLAFGERLIELSDAETTPQSHEDAVEGSGRNIPFTDGAGPTGELVTPQGTITREKTKRRVGRARKQAASLREKSHDGNGTTPPTQQDLKSAVGEIESIATLATSLQAKLDVLQADMAKLSELASLGLTVEALSHELANITDALHQRTLTILDRVRRQPGTDRQVLSFLEHVKSAVVALRKQLSHIAPSLRYARERRSIFTISDFLKEVQDYHQDRLRSRGVELVMEHGEAIRVNMSRGRLTQVLDNLILNSEYWVLNSRSGPSSAPGWVPQIKITHSNGRIQVMDTGPGLAEAIQERIFEPFQTLKESGRGLGLFVARQLLDADKCIIQLLPTLNVHGRPYIFEVNLCGALEENES